MVRKAAVVLALIVMTVQCPPSLSQAQSPTQQEALIQYVADLQKTPNDTALREKIIRYVQTMTPAPAIPEEAERFMARGAAAVKGAKTEADFQDAAREFEKASLAAPWLPAAYYNLGITQDKAGKYREAMQSLKLYLLAAPEASDAKAVKTLIYEIEYRQEKAAKDSSPAAIAETKQNTFEDLLRKIDGRRYTAKNPFYNEGMYLDVRGKVFVKGAFTFNRRVEVERQRFEIRGWQTTLHDKTLVGAIGMEITYTISENGDSIIEHTEYSNSRYHAMDVIYLWKR